MKLDEYTAKDSRNILILAIIAGIIGVWSIASTTVITKDGVFWIELAQKINAGTFEISKIEDYPGYPFMINLWHGLLGRFGLGTSNLSWVLAGQTLGLMCRILSLVPLYFIGKLIVGSRHAFWALLILIFLPWPADSAHDALREWPHLLFLAGSLLLVLLAFTYQRVIFFLPAGLIAGLGHTIRPECAQVIIYGIFGLILTLIHPHKLMTRKKAVLGVILLIVGFLVIFLPYIQIRGRTLPLKLQELLTKSNVIGVSFASDTVNNTIAIQQARLLSMPVDGIIHLVQNLSENQYYYFFFFMLAGLYVFFTRPQKHQFHKLFIAFFIIFNFIMYMTLYYHYGYISRRHVLPLTAMTIFFVPLGLEVIAEMFGKQKKDSGISVNAKKQTTIFLILMAVGILICVPKLARNGTTNIGFRKTAEYLNQNTAADAIIAVPDLRIAFYAERKMILYNNRIPTKKNWDYAVTIDKKPQNIISEKLAKSITKIYSHPLKNSSHTSVEIAVYSKKQSK